MAKRSTDRIELFFNHNVDLDTKTLYLGSFGPADNEEGVDYQLSSNVIKGLITLDNIRPDEPLRLIINNHGGEDDHCRAIRAAIRNCKSQVHGMVYGRAESAAAWILQACTHRVMDKESNIMLHMGSGTKDRHSQHMDNLFVEILLEKLREKDALYSKAKLVRQLHTDWYIYPSQAVALGLVDEVV